MKRSKKQSKRVAKKISTSGKATRKPRPDHKKSVKTKTKKSKIISRPVTKSSVTPAKEEVLIPKITTPPVPKTKVTTPVVPSAPIAPQIAKQDVSPKTVPPPVRTVPSKLPVKPVDKGPLVSPAKPFGRHLVLTPPVTVRNLSEKLGIKVNQLIVKLMRHKIMSRINDVLSEEAILLLALEYNYEIELGKPRDTMKALVDEVAKEESTADLVPRAPVVVLMGHVDHGKTSLLDRIRSAQVAKNEAGAITQHIGAYKVMVNNKKVVFLDTPGHEAFTKMRARGANVTDIVILVVAADDGVMPQTEEALSHAQAAKVPVIVAINKTDKRDANVVKVKQQLAHLELIPEDWGGKTIFLEISALTGQGVEQLVEMLILQAEILELKANPKQRASGTILEAQLSDQFGVLVTALVQSGTLHRGDPMVCGQTSGKIRVMMDDRGQRIDSAGPATPVLLAGLVELPEAGDKFIVAEDIIQGRAIAESEKNSRQSAPAAAGGHITMQSLFEHIEQDKIKDVKVVIKGDVRGSVEVLEGLLVGLSTQEVRIKIIHRGVGDINESDVLLADVSDALLVGFQVGVEERAQLLAPTKKVEIKVYKVIYQLTEDMKLALQGKLEPEKVEKVTAHLAVKNTFSISRLGTIAGCSVSDGKIERSNKVRVKRDKKVIFDGKIASLKRFKEDVREVESGFECGLRVNGFDDVRIGDIIETYRIEEKTRQL